jgi:hypothetical protein
MNFYKCRVSFEVTLDNGKVKNQNREYVVSAVSVTDAEAKLHGFLKNSVEPFEVKTVSETKIVDVILDA